MPLLTADEERELSQDHRGRPRRRRSASRPARRSRELRQDGERRCRGQGPVHPGQPTAGREHRPPLPPSPSHGAAGPHPGGQPGPRARRRQVRLAQGLQVLHLRHLLDPPGHRPGARPEGQPGPPARRPVRLACGPPSARSSGDGDELDDENARLHRLTTPTSLDRPVGDDDGNELVDLLRPTSPRPGAGRHGRPRGEAIITTCSSVLDTRARLRGRAALRPDRRAQAQLPRGRRGARRHRRGGPAPGQAGGRTPSARKRSPAPAPHDTVEPSAGEGRGRYDSSGRFPRTGYPPPRPSLSQPPPSRPEAAGLRFRRQCRLSWQTAHPAAPATLSRLADRACAATLEHHDRHLVADVVAIPPGQQQPDWPDEVDLERALKQLGSLPPLVFAGEARDAHRRSWPTWREGGRSCSRPATAPSRSTAFSADAHPRQAEGHPADGGGAHLLDRRPGHEGGPHRRPVRQAPLVARSRRVGDVELPSFRGHIVNDHALQRRGPRCPIPSGSCQAYHQSAATLNLLRAFTKGGFADLSQVHAWNQEFVAAQPRGPALRRGGRPTSTGPCGSCGACGIDTEQPSRACTRSTSTRATRR